MWLGVFLVGCHVRGEGRTLNINDKKYRVQIRLNSGMREKRKEKKKAAQVRKATLIEKKKKKKKKKKKRNKY